MEKKKILVLRSVIALAAVVAIWDTVPSLSPQWSFIFLSYCAFIWLMRHGVFKRKHEVLMCYLAISTTTYFIQSEFLIMVWGLVSLPLVCMLAAELFCSFLGIEFDHILSEK